MDNKDKLRQLVTDIIPIAKDLLGMLKGGERLVDTITKEEGDELRNEPNYKANAETLNITLSELGEML